MKTIINKIFNQIKFYTIIEPEFFIAKANYKNLLRNVLYYLLIDIHFKKLFKNLLQLLLKVILDFLSIIYLPLILALYLSKFRFLQLDYSQIGIFSHQLNAMCKFHLLKNKTPIICIPKTVSRSHTKRIFYKLIIIDNLILNILFLPLINSELISCCPDYVESFFKNSKLEKTSNFSYCRIIKDYDLKRKNNYFELSKEYSKNMKIFFDQNFKNYEIKNTFILHVRDEGYVFSSGMRNANLRNYLSSIDMLIKNNYNVIRIVHSKSQKLKFSNKYSEINIDDVKNQFLQYYLLSNCRGFICNHSGPAPLGALLASPILELNFIPFEMSYALKKNDLYVPKKIIFKNKKYLHYNELFGSEIRYFNSPRLFENRNLNFIENTEDEVFESVKEFTYLQNKKNYKLTVNQLKYRKNIPSVSSLLLSDANIPDYYLKKNYDLFF